MGLDVNSYFDKIFYINLDRDSSRNEKIITQFEKYKIYNYERVAGTVLEKIPLEYLWRNFNRNKINEKYILGGLGCRNSHWRIMEKSLQLGYKRILVLEDDSLILKDPNETLNQNEDILNDWDMLYFGGIEEPHFRGQIVTTHAYAMSSKLIEETYYMLPSSGMEVDNFYAKILYHMSYNYSRTGKYLIHKLNPFNTIIQDNLFLSNIKI